MIPFTVAEDLISPGNLVLVNDVLVVFCNTFMPHLFAVCNVFIPCFNRFRHAAVRSMLGGRVKPSQLRPKVDVAEVARIVKSPTKTGTSLTVCFL